MAKSSLITTVRLPGFITFLVVAFINAVVDLGHKIIIQNTIFKIYDDSVQVSLTAVVNALILLPFILLFTPAGFLSDRFSKPHIMKWSAFAAVIITLLITFAYYQGWFEFAFAMTFILAAQSALYSPAKYGYVRELVGKSLLSAANGYIQAITIIAILTGIFLFSVLFEIKLADQRFTNEAELIQIIAPIGWALVSLSVLEWLLASRLPVIRPIVVNRFDWQAYRQGHLLKQNLGRLRSNSTIWGAILGLSLFWAVSQTFLASFPAFAKIVLDETNTIIIQGLLACSGIGIMLGSLAAGAGPAGQIKTSFIKFGAIGMMAMLFVIPHLASSLAFAVAITLFGLFGGMFIIPLNALIQLHSPSNELGSILAGNNWIQNLVMVTALLLTFIAAVMAISSHAIILTIPVLVLPLAWLVAKQASCKQ